ncbi:hypothetical protein P43SY_006945 [Pythium insidiosum]|uniref:FAD-binding FR-type domain-containing protein n=1 Tax=Pythium insidiosum TaxID=114742 RepID=A0AAD5MF03_PYTIN|nr:hypothetical protein P43SY_006945 [Pythium insidiosum]
MKSAPGTPEPAEFAAMKTPNSLQTEEAYAAKSGVSSWSSRVSLGYMANVLQLAIVVAMGTYIFGQMVYFTPFYQNEFRHVIGEMWGVPRNNTSGKTIGHPEMVRGTMVTLFGVVPLLGSVLIFEFLRHFNVRRVTSKYVLKVALVLRRKPRVFGKVSYWSYGEWIFFLLLVLGNVLVFYWGYDRRVKRSKANALKKKTTVKFNQYLEIVAITMGFNSIFNMAFLFLPATRNCVWMEFFNISYANGIKYHRWLGVLTVLTAVIHCAGYYWSWLRQGIWKQEALPCFNCNISPKAKDRHGYDKWFNVFGELALIMFLLISVSSIPYVRRKFYDLFYYTHQLFVLAVIFSVMHWAPIVWWCLPTVMVYCVHRAISSANAWTPVQVQELTAVDQDIVKVVLRRAPGRDGHYKVGQFVYLNVPSISKLQWHAFTISSSPRSDPTTLTVLLKSLGDWTRDLVAYADECQQQNVLPTVYLDAYYGASLEMYDEYETLCLVGGGIGATPMFAILEDLVAKLSRASDALPLRQKVVFIFSFRELALLEEVHPVLQRLQELDPTGQYVQLDFYMTRVPSDDVLDQPINYDRLQGKHVTATTYAFKAGSSATPMPFAEPLRSRTFKAVTMVVVVMTAVFIAWYIEYGGGKIKRNGREQLWPLQQFVESAMLFVVGALVFVFVLLERMAKRRGLLGSVTGDDASAASAKDYLAAETPLKLAAQQTDLHTYRDLLSNYNVTLGARPDTKALMHKVFEFHQNKDIVSLGKPVIGVFVSGPEAMKRAVEYGAADVGVSHFDIHEEEFEL